MKYKVVKELPTYKVNDVVSISAWASGMFLPLDALVEDGWIEAVETDNGNDPQYALT